MVDWMEILEEIYAPGSNEQADAVEDDFFEDDFVDEDMPTGMSPALTFGLVGLVGLLVVLGGAMMMQSGKEAPVAQPAVEVQPDCEGELLADLLTPGGVVTAFQHAYYTGKADQLLQTLADDSPMNEENWTDVLPEETVPVCVRVLNEAADTVQADTIVTQAPDSVLVYEQEFHLNGDTVAPRIVSITDREEEK